MILALSEVVVGIDGGGSRVRAVATRDGKIIFVGQGGPGNPLATDRATLLKSYGDALSGCPTPTRVGACVSGAGGVTGRQAITEIVSQLIPGAVAVVGADYLATVWSTPNYDVWVIAGTGSVIVSYDNDRLVTSGGRGWILGDHGSAARLGRGVMEHYFSDPSSSVELGVEISAIAETNIWTQLLCQLNSSHAPGAWFAKFAPLATACAANGDSWAIKLLKDQFGELAATTNRHIESYLSGRRSISVCLAGGVWNSKLAVNAYSDALERIADRNVRIERPIIDAALGAVAFAKEIR